MFCQKSKMWEFSCIWTYKIFQTSLFYFTGSENSGLIQKVDDVLGLNKEIASSLGLDFLPVAKPTGEKVFLITYLLKSDVSSSAQLCVFDNYMPSPSAFLKFGLSILNFFKHAQFFMYTQNHFGILKS